MILDRTLQPTSAAINNIEIPEPNIVKCKNGIDLYIINMGDQDVVRIDLMFGTGKWNQNKKLVAMFSNLLLKEGAGEYDSRQMAEKLDFYGAWLQPSSTFHNSYMTLYSLNKHIENTLPLLEMIIKEPHFANDEFNVVVQRRKQQFIIDDEKVNVKAFNEFVKEIFGEGHPYGQSAVEEDFNNLSVEDLKDFHHKYYRSNNCKIIITGKVTESILRLVNNYFGDEKWGTDFTESDVNFEESPSVPGVTFLEKDDACQSAIRIGLPVVGREHPDYPKLRIVNTLLGGYFGSRLMSSIREELGYTYSIGSSITTLKNGSYLSISTQAATEYTYPLIDAVFDEIEKIKTTPVSDEELSVLKGYLMGEISRLFDGPFSIADAHQALLANDMDSSYYLNMINGIKDITAEEIITLAKRYFDRDKFYTVICGKKTE